MSPTLVAYGGGTNSTALLVGLHERGERPDAIVFADTGGERAKTYAHVERVDGWCASVGFPRIERVQATFEGRAYTLEEHCHRTSTLPSLAYGWRSCSVKFKREPQDAWAKRWEPAREAWARGELVTKLLGFDADEPERAARVGDRDDRFRYRYPLIDEWTWGRAECVAAIERAGLPQPGKSACFFCPASKPHEILALTPDEKARAIAIEDGARENLDAVRGLGRRFPWKPLILHGDAQMPLFTDTPIPCDCFDEAEAE